MGAIGEVGRVLLVDWLLYVSKIDVGLGQQQRTTQPEMEQVPDIAFA